MQISLMDWLVLGVPESIACGALTMLIGTSWLYWNKVIVLGLIQSCLTYLVRLLPITFGIHTIFLTVSLAVLVSKFCRAPFLKSLQGAFATVIIAMTAKTVSKTLFRYLGQILDISTMNSLFFLIIKSFLPLVMMFLVLFVINYKVRLKNVHI